MVDPFLDILMKTIEFDGEVLTFLHNTNTKEAADEILKKGFRFNSHLEYTTDNVSAKDVVTVKYFTLTRQAYGNYTIIIQISREIIERYSAILEDTPHHFSEVLTVCEPELSSDEEFVYQLAPQFVKAYIYSPNSELVLNADFNPYCVCDVFKRNLEKILGNMNK